MRYFIGIDPGWAGSMAWVSEDLMRYSAIAVPDGATDLDIWRMYMGEDGKGVEERLGGQVVSAIIENVHAFPPGKASANTRFRLGWNYGLHRMALTATGMRWDTVSPTVWQNYFGLKNRGTAKLTMTQKKNRHKAKAQMLFPGIKVTHKTADALLLAEYARNLANPHPTG